MIDEMFKSMFGIESTVTPPSQISSEYDSLFLKYWDELGLYDHYNNDFDHGKQHITRVFSFYKKLVESKTLKFSLDPRVAVLSVILHDVTREVDNKDHHISGSKVARVLLKRIPDISESDKDIICNCVLNHRYSKGYKCNMNKIEDFYIGMLQDSDRSESVGSVIVFRSLFYNIKRHPNDYGDIVIDENKIPKSRYTGDSANVTNLIIEKSLGIDISKEMNVPYSATLLSNKRDILKGFILDLIDSTIITEKHKKEFISKIR